MKWKYCFAFYGLAMLILVACKDRVYRVHSSSMEETIMAGDKIHVIKTDTFNKNDIVVFDYYGDDYSKAPDESGNYKMAWQKLVYRLAAISGDLVEIKDGNYM